MANAQIRIINGSMFVSYNYRSEMAYRGTPPRRQHDRARRRTLVMYKDGSFHWRGRLFKGHRP